MLLDYQDRGQTALGEEIPLGCRTLNAAGTPTSPDACPTMNVYDGSGTLVLTKQIPILDKYGKTGLFRYNLFMNSSYAAGRYWVTYDWTTGAGAYVGGSLDTFEVLAGGSANGEVISLFAFSRPHGEHLIGQTNAGKLLLARNPRIS